MNKCINFIKKNVILVVSILVILIGIICGVIAILSHNKSIKNDRYGNPTAATEEIEIEIPEGSYSSDIAKLLLDKGIIEYKDKFVTYAENEGNYKKYKYGIYILSSNMSYEQIDTELQKTSTIYKGTKVTIPEGYELRQIVDLLVSKGIGTKEGYTNSIKEDDFDFYFLKNISKSDVYLEGYLFPATYTFAKDLTEKQVLETMLKKFDSIITDGLKLTIDASNYSLHEIITLASIIEREAGNDTERDIVSSVFHNRLNDNKYPYLESCATVQYILKERKSVLTFADTKINSPYNTYINKGLPPSPIASPGLKSIEAAVNPATTDYLFFVLGKDGNHMFSKTYEQHLKNIESSKK